MKKIVSIFKRIAKDGKQTQEYKVNPLSEQFANSFTKKVAKFSEQISKTSKN